MADGLKEGFNPGGYYLIMLSKSPNDKMFVRITEEEDYTRMPDITASAIYVDDSLTYVKEEIAYDFAHFYLSEQRRFGLFNAPHKMGLYLRQGAGFKQA